MNRKSREAIIFFRAPNSTRESCHKKVYDHAAKDARTSGVVFRWWSSGAAEAATRAS
jgi:hypothetical protein